MALKPTSLASQLADNARKEVMAKAKEDAKVATRATEDGKVWVRLQNAHYDHYGVYHMAGEIALLDEDQIPSAAKKLTKREVQEEVAADGDE